MIKFWPSLAGKCIREIVANQLDPSSTLPSPELMPFLRDGVHLQTGTEEFIREFAKEKENFCFPFNFRRLEPKGKLKFKDEFLCVGKVDGIDNSNDLLEVKCVKNAYFNRLIKSDDWRKIYPIYSPTAQVYLRMDSFTLPAGKKVFGPFNRVKFVFKNRDTSEMIGGLSTIEHPAYIFRKDFIETLDEEVWNVVVQKLRRAVAAIKEEKIPEECDSEKWYCFYCGPKNKRHDQNYFSH